MTHLIERIHENSIDYILCGDYYPGNLNPETGSTYQPLRENEKGVSKRI